MVVYYMTTVDGSWSSRNRWLQCSTTCGQGLTRRLRICNNPRTRYGGKADDLQKKSNDIFFCYKHLFNFILVGGAGQSGVTLDHVLRPATTEQRTGNGIALTHNLYMVDMVANDLISRKWLAILMLARMSWHYRYVFWGNTILRQITVTL